MSSLEWNLILSGVASILRNIFKNCILCACQLHWIVQCSNIYSKIWAENHMISEFIQQDLILSSEDPRHLPVSPHMSIKDYFIVSCKNIWPDFLVVSVSPDIKHLISMFCVQWQFPGSNTINWLITLTRLSHSTLLTSLLWYQWSRETDIKC